MTTYESVERLRAVLRDNAEDAVTKEHYPEAASAYRNAQAMVESELPKIIHEVFIAGAKLATRAERAEVAATRERTQP